MSDAVYGAVLERVRELAQDTFNIYWTSHAQERMDERDIVDAQALRWCAKATSLASWNWMAAIGR